MEIAGKRMSPMDQKSSERVTAMLLAFPAVISATKMNESQIKLVDKTIIPKN